MRSLNRLAVFLLAILLSWTVAAYGQSATGQINGTVLDPSGATVAGATVTLINQGTNLATTSRTNASGNYVFLSVLPGTYIISVDQSGFKTSKTAPFDVAVNQTLTRPVTLQVGATSETVEVVASEGEVLQTTSSELGTVIPEKSIHELPLNGRNFTQLLTLTPGATPVSTAQGTSVQTQDAAISGVPGSSFSKPSINGAQNRSTIYYMDGFLNTDFRVTVYGALPIIDLVSEFKVQSHNDTAEYGGATGGIVNIASKSGTNEFHGGAWEFLRNNFFDARDPITDRTKTGPAPFRQNMFGGAIGGPVIKNRTFFYAGYEGWRYSKPSQQFAYVPTAAELAGDFSASPIKNLQLFNPFSGNVQPFACDAGGNPIAPNANGTQTGGTPCNKIPTQLISPQVQSFWKGHLQAPNLTGVPGFNYIDDQPSTDNANTWQVRIDHRLRDNDNLFFRLTQMWVNDLQAVVGVQASAFSNYHAYNYGGGWNHIFNPNMMLEVRAGVLTKPYDFGRNAFPGLKPGQDAGFTGIDQYDGLMMGLSGTGNAWATSTGGGISVGTSGDSLRNNPTYNFSGGLSWIRGNHTMKFGGSWIRVGRLQINTSQTFTFDSGTTQGPVSSNPGASFASALLGLPQSFNGTLPVNGQVDIHAGSFAFYGQDQWRVTPKLTLTYGLRWDALTQPVANDGRLSNALDLENKQWLIGASSIPACGAVPENPCIPGGIASVPHNDAIVFTGKKYFMPKPVYDNFGPRIGIAYQLTPRTVLRGGYGIFYDTLSARTQYSQNDLEGARWPWSTGFRGSANNRGDALKPGVGLVPLTSIVGKPPYNNLQTTAQPWTPTGNWMDDPRITDSYSHQWNFEVQREISPSTSLSAAYVGSHSERLPYTGYAFAATKASPNGTPASVVNSLKPIPWIDPNIHYSTSTGYANYNSLQMKLNKRFSEGLQTLISYTWSKSLDNSSGFFGVEDAKGAGEAVQNFYDPRSNYAVSGYDIPQYLSMYAVYELPFGRGKHWLSSGPLSWVLGNWQTNYLFSIRSGQPYQITYKTDCANIGGDVNGGNVSSQAYCRPNLVGDPTPSGRNKVSTWFDPTAFTQPAGAYGNFGRNSLRADHVTNMDFSMFKNIPFNDRYSLQFRAEAFNVFNIQALGVPQANLSASGAGVVTSSGNTPRQLQFGLKFLF
jgi:outer membrane receptor protein involved in Fe transport